jgi:phosphate transport system substrate-binding protein
MTKSFTRFALLGISLGALAACDSSPSNTATAPSPGGETANEAGAVNVAGPAIRIVGSSTVYPFTTAVAESFKRKYPSASTPIVESTGTGGGIKLFCGGVGLDHPDIANASRRIKPSEVELCNQNGVKQIVEVQVGLDGIAIAQAKSDEDLKLTPRQVFLALAATKPDGSKNSARTWKDVDPALPARKIEVLGPPPTSGTRDAFNELVMEAGCKTFDNLKALKDKNEDEYKARCTKLREDGAYVEAGENDNLIVQKLVSNPTALGLFGYSYLEENLDKIEGVPLGGVAPTYEAIADGTYPASRPLFIYVKGEHMRAKPALRAFLDEYTSDAAWGPDGYLKARGLIAAPDDVRARNAEAAADLKPLDLASLK